DGSKLRQVVVSGEDRARHDAAVPGGLDIVLHVTDKQSLRRRQAVLFEDLVNHGPLVVNADVGPFQEIMKTIAGALRFEMMRMHGAEKEGPKPALAAKKQEVPRMRQFGHRVRGVPKIPVKPLLQFHQRHVWYVARVETNERQTEFCPKLIERHLRNA